MKNKSHILYEIGPFPKWIAAAMCGVFATGCATNPKTGQRSVSETFASEDPCSNNARNIGLLAGALAGLVIGNQVKHSNTSRVLGAAAGAAIGGMIGTDMDRRRCELSKIAKQNNLEMHMEDIKASHVVAPGNAQVQQVGNDPSIGLKVVLKDNGLQFKSGSDELTQEALAYFNKIADQYSYEVQKRRLTHTASREDQAAVDALKGKRIFLIGHTDDTGSSALNADLSERRAQSVAKIFRDRGIPDEQLFFQGAGETLPIADNRTDEGRARNRRVEIVDLSDDTTLRAYLASRKPALSYYRNSPQQGEAITNVEHSGTQKVTKRPQSSKPVATAQSQQPSTSDNASTPPPVATIKTKSNESLMTASGPSIDFGGEPVGTRPASVDIGKLPPPSGTFSIISSAQADEPVAGSCLQDRPRISHGVKSLKDGKELATRDYLPGLYDSSWAGMTNGHLVAITHVGVLRDGGVPARRPQLLLYRDYKGDTATKATFSSTPEVNAYRGEKGVLYRLFVGGPVRCMDIVIPNDRPNEAPGSNLFYSRGQTMYTAAFNPKLAK